MEKATYILTAVVQKAQKGDVKAMASLYQQFSKAMFNICFRMCGNVPDAEDVLQESFLTAFKNLHQLKDENLFGGWVKRIVVNNCIQHSKKTFYWDNWKEDEDIANEEQESFWDEVDLPKLNDCIKQLPNGCRQIFTLYAVEDYTHKEIAVQLGITEGTSKSQYARAKTLLKEKIIAQISYNG